MIDQSRTQQAHFAVEMLRIALISGEVGKQEFFLARSIGAIADVLGIETLIEAIRQGAELSILTDAQRPAQSVAPK